MHERQRTMDTLNPKDNIQYSKEYVEQLKEENARLRKEI